MASTLRLGVAVAAVAVVIGAVVLWPGGGRRGADPLGLDSDPVSAEVVGSFDGPCPADPALECSAAVVLIEEGEYAGESGDVELLATTTVEAGDHIDVVIIEDVNGELRFSFYDFQRGRPLLLLGLLFALAVVTLGRWRGLGALAGLVASFSVIVWFALPSLVDGNPALAVALVAAGAIAILALYLAHGPGPLTEVALLSTLASLALTALLGVVFVRFARLTGFTDDSSFVLSALGTEIDARGILLAGIVLGSLGVLDDVTVTQVSAVWELHRHAPDTPTRDLFAGALRIGRDHISSTVNTLFLAYAGATLPLLLLFSEIGDSVGSVATREVVATEIVRTMVGSIGLVASVPISTWLAIRVVRSTATPAKMTV